MGQVKIESQLNYKSNNDIKSIKSETSLLPLDNNIYSVPIIF
jgi:hypothetical protein